MRTRRGQALLELAVGMFALALVVSAVTVFATFEAKSLKVQNMLRSSTPLMTGEKFDLGTVLESVAGFHWLRIEERLVTPPLEIVR